MSHYTNTMTVFLIALLIAATIAEPSPDNLDAALDNDIAAWQQNLEPPTMSSNCLGFTDLDHHVDLWTT